MIKSLLVATGKYPEIVKIDFSNGKGLWDVLDGPAQAVMPFYDRSVVMLINSEGKEKNLPLNRMLRIESNGNAVDAIAGNFVLVGYDGEEGSFVDLTDEQLEKYEAMYHEIEHVKTFHAGQLDFYLT